METELVKNDELTDDGRALVGYLKDRLDEVGDNPRLYSELRVYRGLVADGDMTDVEFFDDYPQISAVLWDAYMRSLPDDDVRKVQALADDEEGNPAAAQKAQAVPDATGEESVKALHKNGVLTTEGQKLADLLSRYVPDTAAGRYYMRDVVHFESHTPGDFFRANPETAAELYHWYKHEAAAAVGPALVEQAKLDFARFKNSLRMVEALTRKDGQGVDLLAEVTALAESYGVTADEPTAAVSDAPSGDWRKDNERAHAILREALGPRW